MLLFTSAIRPFDYDARNKPKKWETKAAIPEKISLLKTERHFSLSESSFAGGGVLARMRLRILREKFLRTINGEMLYARLQNINHNNP